MKKLLNIAKSFRDEESGAAMVEYSILIGIITAAVITMIVAVGIYVTGAWTKLCSNLQAHESTVGVTMSCG
ncbi:Flp/Fap pilin component [Mesorhizobium plurifarium]|uniref:Flp/Fap pilin component n=1 Tax=Mesorhizobium plurifarium TaxID=69974 RepID=A0A090EFE1_MESPL|nr:Flp/Fap pilin component [Mesorhizobium plurifarium]